MKKVLLLTALVLSTIPFASIASEEEKNLDQLKKQAPENKPSALPKINADENDPMYYTPAERENVLTLKDKNKSDKLSEEDKETNEFEAIEETEGDTGWEKK